MSILANIKKKAVKKVTTPTRVGAVDLLDSASPSTVASGLDTSLPELTAIDALNPGATVSPTAVLSSTKKTFADTALGKFLSSEGGFAGVATSVGGMVAAVKGTPSTDAAAVAAAVAAQQAADAEAEPDTVLGLPPFAFAAVALLLLLGLVLVIRHSRASA